MALGNGWETESTSLLARGRAGLGNEWEMVSSNLLAPNTSALGVRIRVRGTLP
jgi:hypothetical protein